MWIFLSSSFAISHANQWEVQGLYDLLDNLLTDKIKLSASGNFCYEAAILNFDI